MKNKILLGLLVLALMIGSFFAGVYFEKAKNQKEIASLKARLSQTSPTPPTSPTQVKLTVVAVTDGDTVRFSDGKTFRLYGVNAPEVKEPYYKEAVEFTKNLTLGKEITFEQEEKYKEDKFGRLLGYLFVDGKNLNLELVKVGLAKVVLYEKRAKIKYQDELIQAETGAKTNKVGMWSL